MFSLCQQCRIILYINIWNASLLEISGLLHNSWYDKPLFSRTGSGFQTYSSKRHIEEDIDLDVDGDDSKQYGEPQYPSVVHQSLNDVVNLLELSPFQWQFY